jgi:Mitochondrial carrier protein
LRQHFRYSFKRCFYRYIAGLLVGTVAYPLQTVRERLYSQGASYRIPMRYEGFADCVSQVFAQEGWSGFFQGYLAYAALTLPDLLMVAGQYLVAMFSIEYGPVNTYRNLTKLINGPL